MLAVAAVPERFGATGSEEEKLERSQDLDLKRLYCFLIPDVIRQLCVTATSEPRVCNRSSLTVKRLKKKQKNLCFTRSPIYFTSSLFYKYPARFILSSSQVFKNPKKPSMIATGSLQKKETIRFIVANWHRLGFQIGSETSSVPFF